MLRETILTIPLNPPFIKGDKGINRMVHAKGELTKYSNSSALIEDQDMFMAIKTLIC
jgi:hypothetical protein